MTIYKNNVGSHFFYFLILLYASTKVSTFKNYIFKNKNHSFTSEKKLRIQLTLGINLVYTLAAIAKEEKN